MIAFGIGNTLLPFISKYNSEQEIRDKDLTIGGYDESSWLADLAASSSLHSRELQKTL
jgi:hypothetical protein